MSHPRPKKGDLIFIEKCHKRKGENLTVSKVTREYFYCGAALKFRLSDWREQHSYRQAWPSRGAFEASEQLRQAWGLFRAHVNTRMSAPDSVAMVDICRALQALGMGDKRISLHSDVTAEQFLYD